MCYSLEASAAAWGVVCVTCALLMRRNWPRDRWNICFLSVFGSMQGIDTLIWIMVYARENNVCDFLNNTLTNVAFFIIMFEPISNLLGRSLYTGRPPKVLELLGYFVLFVVLPLSQRSCVGVRGKLNCTVLSEGGHLLYGGETTTCAWKKEHLFFGETNVAEIPFVMRILFLLGIIYPYFTVAQIKPGMIQAVIICATWTWGMMTDATASVWCFANVLQCITLYFEPYIFNNKPPAIGWSPVKRGSRERITQDYYRKSKVPDDVDAIVIGSGISGLSCAALLSKQGKKVLVLEQHYRSGGCTHAFDEHGDIFDSGVHYLGARDTVNFVQRFITDKPVVYWPMGSKEDGFLYDEFDIGEGDMIRYRKGKEALRSELVRRFPKQEAGLDRYLDMVNRTSFANRIFTVMHSMPLWLRRILRGPIMRHFRKFALPTAHEMALRCGISDPRLEAVLTGGQLIDWNCTPKDVSFWCPALMLKYYIDGGFYPDGGSILFAESLIPIIERGGGRVLTQASVKQICTDRKGVSGVELANGDFIPSRTVVSSVGPMNTYGKLLPEETKINWGCPARPDGIKPGRSHVTCYVTLDGPPEKFGIRPANIHSLLGLPRFNFDVSDMQRAFYKNPQANSDALITLTSPSAKDPSYMRHHPGTSNMLLLAEGEWNWFKEFDSEAKSDSPAREQKYLDMKKWWEDIFLERLYKYYPLTKGFVKNVFVGTPLTNYYYLRMAKGASYGVDWTPGRFSDKAMEYTKTVTKVPGLFLTGGDTLYGGIAGALLSGCMSFLHVSGWANVIWTVITFIFSCALGKLFWIVVIRRQVFIFIRDSFLLSIIPGLFLCSSFLSYFLSLYLFPVKERQASTLEVTEKKAVNKEVSLPIYFASHTGTAEGFANLVAEEAISRGVSCATCDLAEVLGEELAKIKTAVLILATHGEGDPPECVRPFFDWLKKQTGERLKGLRYALMGLGNKTYTKYCGFARDVDSHLQRLGATPVHYGEGDDSKDIEEDFHNWYTGLWDSIGVKSDAHPRAALTSLEDIAATAAPLKTHSYVGKDMLAKWYFGARTGVVKEVRELLELPNHADGLTTKHLEIDECEGYETAGNIEILPANPPELVGKIAKLLGAEERLDQLLLLLPAGGDISRAIELPFPPCTLRDALTFYCELVFLPQVPILRKFAVFLRDAAEIEIVTGMLEDRRTMKALYNSKLSLVEYWEAFWGSIDIDVETFLQLIPRQRFRPYTISSSARKSSARVSVTCSLVHEELPEVKIEDSNVLSKLGSRPTFFRGCTSSWVCQRLLAGTRIRFQFTPATLIPDYSVPMVMIAAGTGIAPFRAFAQELAKEAQDAVLFYGCRYKTQDFLYRKELLQNDALRVITAFSREEEKKIYVQHRMKEHSDLLWDMFERQANFYICGSQAMGKEALKVLRTILKEHNSEANIEKLRQDHRILMEVWG